MKQLSYLNINADKSETGPVRVIVVIEDAKQKDAILNEVSSVLSEDPYFKIHQKDLTDRHFTINMSENNLPLIESISGIKEIKVMKQLELHEESSSIDNASEVQENQVQEVQADQNQQKDSHQIQNDVVNVIPFVLLFIAVGCGIHYYRSKKRGHS